MRAVKLLCLLLSEVASLWVLARTRFECIRRGHRPNYLWCDPPKCDRCGGKVVCDPGREAM